MREWFTDSLINPSADVYADSSPDEKVLGRGVVAALMVMDCGSVNDMGITPRAVGTTPIDVRC